MKGIRIGQLLVEQGVLTAVQVQQIVAEQKKSNRPFGDLAERLFGIDPRAVEDAWVEQYKRLVGVTDLSQITMEADCLRMLNRRQAWQFHVLPMSREQDAINVATSAENLVRAVNFSTQRFDEPVFVVLAEKAQLREFLMRYYPVPQHIAEFAASL